MDWLKAKAQEAKEALKGGDDGSGRHQPIPLEEEEGAADTTPLDNMHTRARDAADMMKGKLSAATGVMGEKFAGFKSMVSGTPTVVVVADDSEDPVSSPEPYPEPVKLEMSEEDETESMWGGMQAGLSQELDQCCSLTWKQRLYGFLICACIGFLLSMGSFLRLAKALAGNPKPFAISYSLGNIVSLCSTGFIVGPSAQLKSMFEGQRALTVGTYLACIVLTLVVSLWKGKVPLRGLILMALVACQITAYTYYMLSYIPFGRQLFTKFIYKVKDWCIACANW